MKFTVIDNIFWWAFVFFVLKDIWDYFRLSKVQRDLIKVIKAARKNSFEVYTKNIKRAFFAYECSKCDKTHSIEYRGNGEAVGSLEGFKDYWIFAEKAVDKASTASCINRIRGVE